MSERAANVPAPMTSNPALAPEPAVSVILPTYNERENICDLVDEICRNLDSTGIQYEVVIVDDDSPDGTAAVVTQRFLKETADGTGSSTQRVPVPAEFGQNESRISRNGILRLIVRHTDKGLAYSIREGLECARGATLVVMDTDFNHDPAMIPQMVDLLRYYDLVIGSRFVMRGGMEDVLRYWLSFFYNLFIRLLFLTQIQDHLSGFFAVRRERLMQLESKFDAIFFGYGDYFIRLLMGAWRNEWRILEVPVFYILRRHGASKTGFWKIFRDYTLAIMKLRIYGL